MNSTMLIPKCSSTIVPSPMLARPSQPSMSGNDAFTTNRTWSCTPSSRASSRRFSTRVASPTFRLPPTRTS